MGLAWVHCHQQFQTINLKGFQGRSRTNFVYGYYELVKTMALFPLLVKAKHEIGKLGRDRIGKPISLQLLCRTQTNFVSCYRQLAGTKAFLAEKKTSAILHTPEATIFQQSCTQYVLLQDFDYETSHHKDQLDL